MSLACFAWALGCTFLLSPSSARAQKAPDFTLNDLAGRPHNLSGYSPGNIVLLNFWATWCVPCIKELPHLQRLQDAYGAKGLQVLAVSTDGPDRGAAVANFVGRYGYTFPVLLDTASQVVSLYNPRLNLPYSVLLDRQGVVRYVHQGYSPGDERVLEEKVVALLEEPEAKPAGRTAVRVDEAFLLRLPKEEAGQGDPAAPDDRAINQLDLTLAGGGALIGVRIDSVLALSPLDANLRLAKRYAQYSKGGIRARAGDLYASLGRGLVFSLVKVFEEEGLDYVIDTTVDGGEISAGTGPFTGGIFGGWIGRPEDPGIRDKVIGGSLGWTVPGLGAVRVHGVSAALEPGSEFGNRRVDMGSISLDLPELWGTASIYGEFSLIRRRAYDMDIPLNGHGLYLGSKLRWGRFSLLLEMKDYGELNFEYGRPPLLESEELDILADQFDLDRTDVSGWSVRLDHYWPASGTLLYAKILRVEDTPEAHRLYGSYEREIGHILAGVEKKFAGGRYFHGLAGLRWEEATSPAFLSTDGRTLHHQLNASWPLGRGWSLEADWKHKVFDGPNYEYSEARSGLSLHRSPRWVLSALYERTTDPAVALLSGRKNWWAGQLELRFAGGHSVRVFVGATKGSMKCAGGVCRLFPPFEGLRLEAFLRF